jgi:hypothetical protein
VKSCREDAARRASKPGATSRRGDGSCPLCLCACARRLRLSGSEPRCLKREHAAALHCARSPRQTRHPSVVPSHTLGLLQQQNCRNSTGTGWLVPVHSRPKIWRKTTPSRGVHPMAHCHCRRPRAAFGILQAHTRVPVQARPSAMPAHHMPSSRFRARPVGACELLCAFKRGHPVPALHPAVRCCRHSALRDRRRVEGASGRDVFRTMALGDVPSAEAFPPPTPPRPSPGSSHRTPPYPAPPHQPHRTYLPHRAHPPTQHCRTSPIRQ